MDVTITEPVNTETAERVVEEPVEDFSDHDLTHHAHLWIAVVILFGLQLFMFFILPFVTRTHSKYPQTAGIGNQSHIEHQPEYVNYRDVWSRPWTAS